LVGSDHGIIKIPTRKLPVRLRKTTWNLTQDSTCAVRNSNWVPLESKSTALLLHKLYALSQLLLSNLLPLVND